MTAGWSTFDSALPNVPLECARCKNPVRSTLTGNTVLFWCSRRGCNFSAHVPILTVFALALSAWSHNHSERPDPPRASPG